MNLIRDGSPEKNKEYGSRIFISKLYARLPLYTHKFFDFSLFPILCTFTLTALITPIKTLLKSLMDEVLILQLGSSQRPCIFIHKKVGRPLRSLVVRTRRSVWMLS